MLDRVPVTRRVKGMKRILSILCALMLFCGCGNNRDDADGDDNQSEESGKATPEQDEETAKPAQPPAETETETPAETSPQAESSPKEEAEEDETDKPLSAVLVEQGLPVLLEYAKLLREFEQGKNDSPGSFLDLALGAANVARKLAIDVLPVEEGWQEKTGDRFHKYVEEECEIIDRDRRLENHDMWFKEILAEAKKKDSPVVVVHYPLFVKTPGEKESYYNIPTAKRMELLKLCEENGVVGFLAGHTQKLVVNDYKGMQLVNGETTSRNFDKRPMGFRWWDVAAQGKMIHRFVAIEGMDE